MSAAILEVIGEEQALLDRVRAALERARQRPRGRANTSGDAEELRDLRDQAAQASDDDLPALLHDLAVTQRLAARRAPQVLPDPSSPYIAHLRVDEGKGAEDYLLGHVTFFDSLNGVHVLDWRNAPLARIFYRYREGDRFEEEFPGRVAEGVVLARRIVVIENGELTRVVGDGLVLERDAGGEWQESSRAQFSLQGGGSGTAARPGILGVGVGASGRARPQVTALLDAEQYAAISAPPDEPLLVLGSAGSGKTTVALHRLAHVNASDPRRYPLADARVVVPEEGLARLSRRLLEPLGVGASRVATIDAWATRLAGEVFGRGVRVSPETPPLVTGFKRHPALFRALGERFPAKPSTPSRLPRLRRRLREAFSDRAFLEAVVRDSDGGLPWTAVDETIRHTVLQLEESSEKQMAAITDVERRRGVDGLELGEGTPAEVAGTLDVEDLPILMALHAREQGLGVRPVSLLVLDEAEDFSLFELYVLGSLLREEGSITLAGDEAQQTTSSFAGWETSLRTVGAGGASTCRLPTSYRCPRPVTDLARQVLGPLAPEAPTSAAREGAPVGIFRLPSEAQAHLFLAGAVREVLEREPAASIGVIAATPEAARKFHGLLGDLPEREARLVIDGGFTFQPGIDVTDVDEVKGLEFDYVVVPDATAAAYPQTNEARHRLHVAITRASHQLWVAAGGTVSPLLAGG